VKHYFVILCLLLLLFVVVVVVVVANVVGKGRLLCVLKAEGQKVRLLLLFFFCIQNPKHDPLFFFFVKVSRSTLRPFDVTKKETKKDKKKRHTQSTRRQRKPLWTKKHLLEAFAFFAFVLWCSEQKEEERKRSGGKVEKETDCVVVVLSPFAFDFRRLR
jgi:hypothetical protein